jgi:dTDP-4-amino-4,6-dideoxygalactose transaminase
MKIAFNKPYFSGRETAYILEAVAAMKISGDGVFTKRCHDFFEKRYGFSKCLLTTSCTDALEMAALLLDIKPGDEVIAPSFTFSSTVNAFILRGAKVVFVDSRADHPGIDEAAVEAQITPATKALLPMHYAGVACDMDPLLALAKKHRLAVVEDAAQAVDSFYKGKPLGSFGALSAFSFHETKNIISGEGGMLAINDARYSKRAEIIREKGTNRSAFFRGEVDKYGWVDIGSSFLPSDIIAAVLYAQTEKLDEIQTRRKQIWGWYNERLSPLQKQGKLRLPFIPPYATGNGHLFYVVCNTPEERSNLIGRLKPAGIAAVFHYQSLHKSAYYRHRHDGRSLPNADRYTDCLLRLPLFYELTEGEVDYVCENVVAFFKG